MEDTPAVDTPPPSYPLSARLLMMVMPTLGFLGYLGLLAFMAASFHWWPWPWAAIPLIFVVLQVIVLPKELADRVQQYRDYRNRYNALDDVLEDAAREPGDNRPYDRYQIAAEKRHHG